MFLHTFLSTQSHSQQFPFKAWALKLLQKSLSGPKLNNCVMLKLKDHYQFWWFLGSRMCALCPEDARRKNLGDRCKGHGVDSRLTRWRSTVQPKCHGKWRRVYETRNCPCKAGPDFIFVWNSNFTKEMQFKKFITTKENFDRGINSFLTSFLFVSPELEFLHFKSWRCKLSKTEQNNKFPSRSRD